jgi:Rho termination factor, N-terminal domain
MLLFSNSSAISMIDDLLTDLIVIISISFSLYLLVMFVLGAIARCSLRPITIPVQIPAPIFFQDAIVPFKRPLTQLTIRQLRQRAKEAKIPKYSRMLKLQLIAALQVL